MRVGIVGMGKLGVLIRDTHRLTNDNLKFYDDFISDCLPISDCDSEAVYITIGIQALREKLFNEFRDRKILRFIHPTSYVSSTAVVGLGSILSAFVAVHDSAKIGTGCMVYSNTTIDVNAELSEFVRVSAQCYIGANVKIGKSSAISAGVTILPNITIGDNVYVAAGTVVTKSVGSNLTIAGVPARVVNGNNELHRQN